MYQLRFIFIMSDQMLDVKPNENGYGYVKRELYTFILLTDLLLLLLT